MAARNPQAEPKKKVASGPMNCQSVPAIRPEGKDANPMAVWKVPREVPLNSLGARSETNALWFPSTNAKTRPYRAKRRINEKRERGRAKSRVVNPKRK